MKTLFLLNGIVVGHAIPFDQSTGVSCSIAGSVPHSVDDSSPISDGWTYTEQDGQFEFTEPVVVTQSIKVSPVEFKLLFSAQERVAIKQSNDPLVQDFFELVENQRIVNAADAGRGLIDLGLQSTQVALGYLEGVKLIGEGRATQILTGIAK